MSNAKQSTSQLVPGYLQLAGNKTAYRINKGMIEPWWDPGHGIRPVHIITDNMAKIIEHTPTKLNYITVTVSINFNQFYCTEICDKLRSDLALLKEWNMFQIFSYHLISICF